MVVTCPHCGAAHDVHADRVPKEGIDMKCTECLELFTVESQTDAVQYAAPDLPGVTFLGTSSSGTGATDRFYIQRTSGKVFGPFEKRLVVQMLKARKLSGDESVSLDKDSWVPISTVDEFAALLSGRETVPPLPPVAPPAPEPVVEESSSYDVGDEIEISVSDDAELPVPIDIVEAELPTPVADAELPTPLVGVAELLAPVKGEAELLAPVKGEAELLAPVVGAAELPTPVGGAELPTPIGGAELLGQQAGAELPGPAGTAELPGFVPDNSNDEFAGMFGAQDQSAFGDLENTDLGADAFAALEPPSMPGSLGGDDLFGSSPGAVEQPGVFDEFDRPSDVGFSQETGHAPSGDEFAGVGEEALEMPPPMDEFLGPPGVSPIPQQAPAQHVPLMPHAETGMEAAAIPKVPKRSGRSAVGTSRLLVLATVLVGVALAAVVGLIYVETDLFEEEQIVQEATPSKAPVEVVRPGPTRAKFEDIRRDVYSGYRKSIETTVKALGSRPDDVGLKAKLVTSLVLYLAHYPEDTQYMKEVARHAKDLEGETGLDAQLGRGAYAVLASETGTVHRELFPLTEKRGYEYMSNLLIGLSSTFAMRLEGDLPAIPAPPPVAVEDSDAGTDEADASLLAGGDAAKDEVVAKDAVAAKDEAVKDKPKSGGRKTKDGEGEDSSEMDFVREVMAKERENEEKEWRAFAARHFALAQKVDPTAPAPLYWSGINETDALEPKAALRYFGKLLQHNPKHVPGLLSLSHLSYLTGDLDAARSHAAPVTKGLSAAASKRERSEAHLLIGLIAQARRKSDDAQKSLIEALSIDPNNTRALKALGQEFKRNRNYKDALTYFTTNKGLSQKDPEVMIGIVTSLLGLERQDEAMKRLEQGIAAFPEDPRFAFHLARIHARQGHLQFARSNYEKAIAADEDFHRAYVALALLTVQSADNNRDDQGKALEKAWTLLKQAEARGATRDAEVAVELGEAYMKLGNRKRALSILNTALRLNASNLDARMGLARYYLRSDNAKRAAELLKPFEDSDVEDQELKMLLARVYRAHGQYERAVDHFDQLSDKNPESAEYLFERGLTYFLWENYATAREDFLGAYKRNPNMTRAYFYVGRVHLAENQFDQAMKVFRTVLDYSPQVGEFRFYFAYALEKNRNLPQALEEYRQIDRYDGEYGKKNPEMYYRRGRIYFRQGNYRRAKQDLKLALTYNPKHVGALLTLADTIFNEGEYQLAISLYQRALAENSQLANAHYRLGLANGYLSKRAQAIKEFERALALGLKGRPASDARRKLGYEYRDSGNRGRAVKRFQEYLKFEPKAGDRDEVETEIRRLGGRVQN